MGQEEKHSKWKGLCESSYGSRHEVSMFVIEHIREKERDCIQIENSAQESWYLDWGHVIRKFLDSILRSTPSMIRFRT